MDEGWIITTAITLGIGVISYFLKRTMNQLDCTVQQLQKIERDSVTKADLKETTDELKKDINKIREDYTPKETHSKDFDGCQKEIKEIRQNYLTKDDFIREINKVDRKVEQMLNMMIEMTRNGEQEKRRLRAGAFMVNNGRVLMTINLLREKYNALRSVEKGLKAEGIERQEFIDSVNFLHEEGYIYLRDMESREPANLADVEYQTLEAKVTGKGIRLLGGGITDEMVDLDG